MKGEQGLNTLAELCGASEESSVGSQQGTPTVPTNSTAASLASKPGVSSDTTLLANAAQQTPQQLATASVPQQQQQWQQALGGGGALLGFNAAANPTAAAQAMALMQAAALQSSLPQTGTVDQASMNAIQQVAYYQLMQQFAQNAALQMAPPQHLSQQQQQPGNGNAGDVQVPLAFAGQNPQVSPQTATLSSMADQQATVPQPAVTATTVMKPPPPTTKAATNVTLSSGNTMQPPDAASSINTMLPPAPPSQVQSSQTSLSTNGIATSSPMRTLPAKVMLKPSQQAIAERALSSSEAVSSSSVTSPPAFEDKKQLKRAANRRSAQLSRKRKKQFIEELKEENDELRRKEQILKSIPDLIVVFDSSGKLWFVSHSVSRFLDFSPRELEGSSFWERLCDESVRLLKAAFMDALAARKGDMDRTPLGSGVWELRLQDKDGSQKLVTLNGVVHFSGEAPECVCSIRPREEESANAAPPAAAASSALPTHRNVSVSSGGTHESSSIASSSVIRAAIKPQQSVISNRSEDSDNMGSAKVRRRAAHQISDSGSCVSESGSDQ